MIQGLQAHYTIRNFSAAMVNGEGGAHHRVLSVAWQTLA